MRKETVFIEEGYENSYTFVRNEQGYSFERETDHFRIQAETVYGLLSGIYKIDEQIQYNEEAMALIRRWETDEKLPALTSYIEALREKRTDMSTLRILMFEGKKMSLENEYRKYYDAITTTLNELDTLFSSFAQSLSDVSAQDIAATFCDMLLAQMSSEKEQKKEEECSDD